MREFREREREEIIPERFIACPPISTNKCPLDGLAMSLPAETCHTSPDGPVHDHVPEFSDFVNVSKQFFVEQESLFDNADSSG